MSVESDIAAGPSEIESVVRRRERVTVPSLLEMKRTNRKIVVVTAYDFPSAKLAEKAEIDVVLVGDTLGLMILGYDTTLPVLLEDIEYHVRAVRRGLKKTLLLADMPFGTYQLEPAEAVRNAVRLMQAGAQAVKIEGGVYLADAVRRMTDTGIPVMAHLGLTPQSYHLFGGNKAQGTDPEAAKKILSDALALQNAGAFAILLEAIPSDLASEISRELTIPTIGIGAGPGCNGEVQVWHDILGIPPGKGLRHTKRYADVGIQIENALRAYAEEVRDGLFPTKENSL